MFKFLAVTIAALYLVMLHFGDATRRPVEVARAEPMELGFSPVAFDYFEQGYVSPISDAEAVRLAIEAHKTHQQTPVAEPVEMQLASAQTVASDATPTPAMTTDATPLWEVTGSRVNLRGGPGTGNAVVGQVALGDRAEVLDQTNGWYQIRLADGSASGWIYGKFLTEKRPG